MVSDSRRGRDLLGPIRTREIGEAALRVIEARGLDGTTMQAVAEEAGLSKGALYLYFRNREELVRHLAQEAMAELIASVDAALALPVPARAALEAALRAHVVLFERRRAFFRVYVALAHPGPDAPASARRARACHPLYAAYLERLSRFLAAADATGELLCPRPDRMALFLAEGLNGLLLRRLTEPEPPAGEEDLSWLLAAVFEGIAPPAPTRSRADEPPPRRDA